ncbi:hypothetical protein SO802_012660 [Lithocarpus litseifolius]|uniref:Uncharacterized protein n=1 Tax=Lithocarpus litseifolius TaxID=425828 RepID=A0AAW2D472_9ROSI
MDWEWRFQHLHGGTLTTRANPEARLGRVPPTQLGDIIQGPTQHPQRPLPRQTPPFLHCVRRFRHHVTEFQWPRFRARAHSVGPRVGRACQRVKTCAWPM